MRKFLLAAFLFLVSGLAFGQAGAGQLQNGAGYQVIWATTCNASGCNPTGPNTSFFIPNSIGWYQLSWTVDGTVSTCGVRVDSAPDSNTSFTSGGIIAAQVCTSAGSFTTASANYVNLGKITVSTAITGSGANVTFTLLGFVNNPASSGGGGGSGTVNSGTAGHIAYYVTSTNAVSSNAKLDDGATTANTLTYTGTGGITAADGPVSSASDGTHAGGVALAGNTLAPALSANLAYILGPNSATFTDYALQLSGTGPAAAGFVLAGAPSSSVSQITYGTAPLNYLTGSAAVTTWTEAAAGDPVTLAGVETAALTYPAVIQNTSASNNSSGALIINTAGAGTGQVPLLINEATVAGNFVNMISGGTVTNGVESGGTSKFSIANSGNLSSAGTGSFGVGGSNAGGLLMTAGTANGHATASTVTLEAPAAVTAYEIVLPGSSSTGVLHATDASSVNTWSISAVVNGDITSMAESKLTGSTAATTITEAGTGDAITRAGVETANLTYPYVIQNTSTSANTSGALIVNTAGAGGTAQVPLFINETVTAGNLINATTGGTVTNGVESGGTIEFSVSSGGNIFGAGNIQTGGPVEAKAAATAIVVQGGQDATTGSPGGLTARGGSVTGGSTASLSGGTMTVQGGDNASSGATETGGAVTIRGGDTTNASAAVQTTGAVTIRGGNNSATGAGATLGAVTITGGTQSGAATNQAGADVTVAGGLGTGNSTSAHVKLQAPSFSNTSGTTAQTQATTYVVHKKAGSTTSATPTNMFQITVGANQTIGAEIIVHVETTQATPHNCSTTETFVAAVQNTAATVTQQTTAGTTATICDTGTLTLAATFSAATPSVFSVTPSWTTIAPSGVIITVEVHNVSQQDISLL